METKAPIYQHLKPGDDPPKLEGVTPFKAVVVIDSDDVTFEWQAVISDWLVKSGCLYMMAWGHDCSSWDDSVDWANLEMFDYGEIPEHQFVFTTWHEKDLLQEAFWFCGYCAFHPTVELKATYIVHIAQASDAASMLEAFQSAQESD